MKASDKTSNGSGAQRTAQAGGSRQPDSGLAQRSGTRRADIKAGGRLFFVLGGIATATALQQIYERAFDLPHRRMKDILHRLAWLAVLIGTSLLTGWVGPGLRHAG